jgi:hypothetical protein
MATAILSPVAKPSSLRANGQPRFQGLDPVDVVFLYADHDGMESRPSFYRDHLWLNWRETRLSIDQIAHRWGALSAPTRELFENGAVTKSTVATVLWRIDKEGDSAGSGAYVAVGRTFQRWRDEDGLSQSQIARKWNRLSPEARERGCPGYLASSEVNPSVIKTAIHRARKERSAEWLRWLLRRPRRKPGPRSQPYRNALWKSWYCAEQAVTYHNLIAIAAKWNDLPDGTIAVLTGGFAGKLPLDEKHRKRSSCVVGRAVKEVAVGNNSADNSRPATRDASRRRALWLDWREAGFAIAEIPNKWNRLPESERRGIAGPYYRKLRTKHGHKSNTNIHLGNQIRLARWEREIRGKPAAYGFGLWCLKRMREQLNPQDVLDKWNRMPRRTRRQIAPDAAQALPIDHEQREASLRKVKEAALRAKQLGGDGFLDSLTKRTWGPANARMTKPCAKRDARWAGLRAKGSTISKIVSQWNDLSDQEREAEAPWPHCRRLPSGKQGRQIVEKAISRFHKAGRTDTQAARTGGPAAEIPPAGTLAGDVADGPVSPGTFRYGGKLHSLDLQDLEWRLLVYLWEQLAGGDCIEVEVPRVAAEVWRDRKVVYGTMKKRFCRLNRELTVAGIPLEARKPKGGNVVRFGRF